jgi:transcriptional regulator with XRE-family HTH domain
MIAKTSPNDLLRQLRMERGWSQQRVAELLQNMGGVTDSKLVGKWERGKHKPSPFYQERLCKLYGFSASQLGFYPPEEESPAQGQEQQELGEQYYLNLALQILEMAASEYQWSSDVLVSKLDELRNVMKKSNAGEISRRQLIMLGVGGILLVSNPSVLVPEEILPFVQQNIATCWKMSNGGRDELTHARQMISSYMPTLTQLATQLSPHQKTAASQAAACYGLRSLLDYHLENLVVAEEDAKQFLHYSKLSEDPEWIVRAYVRYALIAYYRGQPEQALAASREANRYKKHVSPAVRFSLYKEQATYEAQIGLKDEANATLHLAYENLLQATHGQSRAYVDTNLYEWALWKGTTHYHLGEYKEAKNILESVDPLNPDSLLPERVRTGLLNNLVFAELRIKERDLERCLMLWERSSEGAKKLQSELRLAEVRRAHDRLVLFFPHEPRVAALKEQIGKEISGYGSH